ncbi:CAP domain-containing protein [Streptomyces sp. NPDC088387]|uniref:CAP domain-containing protein n=1 Tax=Streptomyces sp. NPDC088387 TaxID=3365859 RepID=UPI00382AB9E2
MSVSRFLASALVGAVVSTTLLTTTTTASAAPGAAPASAPAAPGASRAASIQRTVVNLTNGERKRAGCPALKIRSALHRAAERHSADMARNDYMGHVGSNGSTLTERIEAAGYKGWSALAENVAVGQRTPADVVGAWMESPGHRANILNCSLKHIGVGYVKRSGTHYGTYWTQDFGAKT